MGVDAEAVAAAAAAAGAAAAELAGAGYGADDGADDSDDAAPRQGNKRHRGAARQRSLEERAKDLVAEAMRQGQVLAVVRFSLQSGLVVSAGGEPLHEGARKALEHARLLSQDACRNAMAEEEARGALSQAEARAQLKDVYGE